MHLIHPRDYELRNFAAREVPKSHRILLDSSLPPDGDTYVEGTRALVSEQVVGSHRLLVGLIISATSLARYRRIVPLDYIQLAGPIIRSTGIFLPARLEFFIRGNWFRKRLVTRAIRPRNNSSFCYGSSSLVSFAQGRRRYADGNDPLPFRLSRGKIDISNHVAPFTSHASDCYTPAYAGNCRPPGQG